MVTSTRLWLLLVLGIGLIVGLIAFANLEIINPDGVLYIYQAKAVYRQISATIRQSSHADGVAEGAGSRPLFINESFFYANTATADPVCHQSFNVDANSMSELLTQMKSQGLDYFLWETGLCNMLHPSVTARHSWMLSIPWGTGRIKTQLTWLCSVANPLHEHLKIG